MELITREMTNEENAAIDTQAQFNELCELQLVLVGGGIGNCELG